MQCEATARAVSRRHHAGFTLIELMVVLVVFGLLLGTIISPLVTQLQVREIREARSAMDRIQGALTGFAQANGRLPCPDTAGGDGLEDACAGAGTVGGILPWQTLGIAPGDRWGRVYLYHVTRELTGAAIPGKPLLTPPAADGSTDLGDTGAITVLGDRDVTKTPITITTSAAAVVISTGANGHCGTRVDGTTLSPPDGGARWNCAGPTGATAADEYENLDGDATFVSRQRSEGGATCDDDTGSAGPLCAFDDLVIWVPTSILLGKLIEAGQLP